MIKRELAYFWKGARFVALFPILYLVLLFINHRFQLSDFNVYYGAAHSLVNGDQVYGIAYGLSSGFYKYSPEALIPFMPFAYLKYEFAAILYYLINTLVFVLLVKEVVTYHLNKVPNKRLVLVTCLLLVFFADMLERELFLGNVNAMLLWFALLVYRFAKEGKSLYAGLLFGVMLLFKVHFIILLPYFLYRKEFKVLAYTFFSIAASALLFLALFPHWFFALHVQWQEAVAAHNGQLAYSANTVYPLFAQLFGRLGINYTSNLLVALGLALVSGSYFIFLLLNKKKGLQWNEFAVLLACIPILTHTDTEHFIWTLPFVSLYFTHVFEQKTLVKWVIVIVLVLTVIPLTLNAPDIVGPVWSKRFDEGGLGLAIQVMLALALGYFIGSLRKNSEPILG
jgi:hypothetical protein